MTEPLFLDSLEIRHFRAFEYLGVERLGRVNLIVGKNNVGKSSMLEALWLYTNDGHPAIIWRILESRDEARNFNSTELNLRRDLVEEVRHLFYGRHALTDPIQIGALGEDNKALVITPTHYIAHLDQFGKMEWRELAQDDGNSTFGVVPALKIQKGSMCQPFVLDGTPLLMREKDEKTALMMPASGLTSAKVSLLWDRVSLTSLEEEVIKALQIIAPDVERLNLISNRYEGGEGERLPMVKTKRSYDPVPLRSHGEGMNRLFGLALALVNSKEGVCLIDEVESGLHYSVQSQIWQLIFEVARRLNIQVFATTHSWDCITAFQEAAKEYGQDEGVLIRLLERNGKIITVQFDENELGIVAREGIEIR